MIYVRLFGGLGNQLFQYSTARALSLRVGTGVIVDTRYLSGEATHMSYALKHFRVALEKSSPYLPPHAHDLPLRYLLWRFGLGHSPRFMRESSLRFDASVLSAPDETYLHGYFQSERYFLDRAAEIKTELQFVTPPSLENRRWIAQIEKDDRAISVHVRRGDYIADPKAAATYRRCDEAYYRQAIQEIAARTGIEPRAYVFSDDPQWAKMNLSLGIETFVVEHNQGEAAFEDLRLMTLCRHHVIANSTFSWWGAWLSGSEQGVKVGPAVWFSNDKDNSGDLIPESWIMI